MGATEHVTSAHSPLC